ncbi:ABC transporter [Rhodococcus pyridinivorans SB3094]|uniref:ABC-type quaternary amine transporter n=1 Tax=Rhodococcus pyridinivorans SB3094 TaxID=1435356 RepID=V9XF37_9NOCA|nr:MULTISPECIES: ABC transporter ATP-binding protein [Rhodococcus]AHD20600.1 ABC transporter [Rhodococcus pyridinivorans SB3094]MCT7292391.1 ABC transporter ATP-binding protein [Rhodococcus sp. PAE-6]
MTGLTIENVSARYGAAEVVTDVTLDVPRGDLLAVLGPSGGGKTTLLRVAAGLHPAASGRVSVDDVTVTDVPPERRGVGLVPQEGALFPHLNVARNIGYGLGRANRPWRGGAREEHRRRVEELLDLVGLPRVGHRKPSALSGGQQQRIALARALAPRPSVVLLDEPFSALDAGLRASLRADVRTLLREQSVAAVLVTHDQTEALAMADRLAVMLDGRIAQVGSPEEVYGRPASVAVGEFVGEAIILEAEAFGDCAQTPLGKVQLVSPGHGVGRVLLRPEQIEVGAAPTKCPAAGSFTVRDTAFGGAHSEVRVEGMGIAVRALCTTLHGLQAGDPVTVSVRRPVPFYPGG